MVNGWLTGGPPSPLERPNQDASDLDDVGAWRAVWSGPLYVGRSAAERRFRLEPQSRTAPEGRAQGLIQPHGGQVAMTNNHASDSIFTRTSPVMISGSPRLRS